MLMFKYLIYHINYFILNCMSTGKINNFFNFNETVDSEEHNNYSKFKSFFQNKHKN